MRKYMELLLKLRFRNRHQMYAVLILAMFSIFSIYTISKHKAPRAYPDTRVPDVTRKQAQKKPSARILDGRISCPIPDLDPFSEEMMKYNGETPKVKCEGADWVECEGSRCSMKPDVLKNMREVICIYKDIIYKDEQTYMFGEPIKVHNGGTYHLNRSDHVKVSCAEKSLAGPGITSNRWQGYKAGLRPIKIPYSNPKPDAINVMILCFDSASRNGFIRRMPRSYKILTDEMGATILNGYNIIEDSTAAAIIPLLTGKTELELPEARINFEKENMFDPKHFIFRQVRKHGYRSAYFEDMPWIGILEHRLNGFKSQPADHYLRTFLLEEGKYRAKWWNGINRRHCVGAVPQYGLFLNLSRQFLDFNEKHFCFTFIRDISHEDFNYISTADEDVAAFLRHLKDSNKLHDHLVIVMGDHGLRNSPLRETHQGRIEERLPLMGIILPDILKKNRPEAINNLNSNANILTTPFDMHTTIVDAMGLRKLINKYSVPGSDLPRGMSLLKPIPKTRTCGQSGILSHWCACAKWESVSEADPIYLRIAEALEKFINHLTQDVRSQCVERKLLSVEWVMKQVSNDDLLIFHQGRDEDGIYHKYVPSNKSQPSIEIYQAKIVMSPGRAIFEGSMIYEVKERAFVMNVLDISRITAYGDEPKCISARYPHLNKFCFCKGMQTKIKVIS